MSQKASGEVGRKPPLASLITPGLSGLAGLSAAEGMHTRSGGTHAHISERGHHVHGVPKALKALKCAYILYAVYNDTH